MFFPFYLSAVIFIATSIRFFTPLFVVRKGSRLTQDLAQHPRNQGSLNTSFHLILFSVFLTNVWALWIEYLLPLSKLCCFLFEIVGIFQKRKQSHLQKYTRRML